MAKNKSKSEVVKSKNRSGKSAINLDRGEWPLEVPPRAAGAAEAVHDTPSNIFDKLSLARQLIDEVVQASAGQYKPGTIPTRLDQRCLAALLGLSPVATLASKGANEVKALLVAAKNTGAVIEPGRFTVEITSSERANAAWKQVAIDNAAKIATLENRPFDAAMYEKGVTANFVKSTVTTVEVKDTEA